MDSQNQTDGRSIAGYLAVALPVAIALGNFASEAVLAAIAVLFVVRSVRESDFAWARQPWVAFALALWAYGVLRNGFMDTSWQSLGVSIAWVRFIIGAAALATWVLPDPLWRRRIVISGAAAVGFMAADALLQYAIGRDIIGRLPQSSRLTAEFPRPMVGIEIAWLFFPVLMGLLAERMTAQAAVFGAVCAAAILLSGERYALLLAIAYFACATLALARLRKAALWTVPAAAVILVAVYVLIPKTFQRQVTSSFAVASNLADSPYGVIWASALRIAADHPVFGVGLNRYRDVCPDPKYGPELAGPQHWPRCSTHPHNIYLEWLTQTGAIGLIGFVAFAGAVLLRLGRRFRSDRSDLVFAGLAITIALRFWPLASSTSFFIAWSAVPLWFLIGWAMAIAGGPKAQGHA